MVTFVLKAIECLKYIGKIAEGMGFQVAKKPWYVSYATDLKTIDDSDIPEDMREAYAWAKIQYQQRAPVMFSSSDTPSQRVRKEHKIEKWEAGAKNFEGYVLHTWWGEGCEPTNIGLVHRGRNGKVWRGSSFTKTQWAVDFVKAHVAVCALLKFIQQTGLLKSVYDEGHYWEDEDFTKLLDNFELNNKGIAAICTMLQKAAKDTDATIEGHGLKSVKTLKEFPRI